MPLKRKIGLAAATACVAAGIFGASAGSASAAQLTTGLNSPEGTNTVVLPESATPGAANAVTQVITKGPGSLSNITVGF